MSINNEVKIYVKNIKKRLLYNTKESKRYLKNLETNIMEYVDEFQVTDMAAIKNHFGSENEIANAYFETVELKTVKRKINIKRIIAIFIITIVCTWIGYLTVALISTTRANPDYIIESNITENISQNIIEES